MDYRTNIQVGDIIICTKEHRLYNGSIHIELYTKHKVTYVESGVENPKIVVESDSYIEEYVIDYRYFQYYEKMGDRVRRIANDMLSL